jgi:hypothetical protein
LFLHDKWQINTEFTGWVYLRINSLIWIPVPFFFTTAAELYCELYITSYILYNVMDSASCLYVMWYRPLVCGKFGYTSTTCSGEQDGLKCNVHWSVHRNNILIYIQQDAMLHSWFYLETALHVSGGTITYHQQRK